MRQERLAGIDEGNRVFSLGSRGAVAQDEGVDTPAPDESGIRIVTGHRLRRESTRRRRGGPEGPVNWEDNCCLVAYGVRTW